MGILGESGPSGSPNLDAISVQKMPFFTPASSPGCLSLLSHQFSDLVSKKLCYHYLDQNGNKIHFEFAYFSVFIQLELKLMLQPVISSKPLPIPDQNGHSLLAKFVPVFRPKRRFNGGTYLYARGGGNCQIWAI